MTVEELRQELLYYESAAEVIIATQEWCPEGYPEWDGFLVGYREGKVVIYLESLTEDCQ